MNAVLQWRTFISTTRKVFSGFRVDFRLEVLLIYTMLEKWSAHSVARVNNYLLSWFFFMRVHILIKFKIFHAVWLRKMSLAYCYSVAITYQIFRYAPFSSFSSSIYSEGTTCHFHRVESPFFSFCSNSMKEVPFKNSFFKHYEFLEQSFPGN